MNNLIYAALISLGIVLTPILLIFIRQVIFHHRNYSKIIRKVTLLNGYYYYIYQLHGELMLSMPDKSDIRQDISNFTHMGKGLKMIASKYNYLIKQVPITRKILIESSHDYSEEIKQCDAMRIQLAVINSTFENLEIAKYIKG